MINLGEPLPQQETSMAMAKMMLLLGPRMMIIILKLIPVVPLFSYGGITGTKRADADADVILNGQSANDEFGGTREDNQVVWFKYWCG